MSLEEFKNIEDLYKAKTFGTIHFTNLYRNLFNTYYHDGLVLRNFRFVILIRQHFINLY